MEFLSQYGTLIFMIVLMVIMYLIMFRPQKKREKKRERSRLQLLVLGINRALCYFALYPEARLQALRGRRCCFTLVQG